MTKRKDMKAIKVISEELNEYPVADFMDKCVYNHCKPEIGKTKNPPDLRILR